MLDKRLIATGYFKEESPSLQDTVQVIPGRETRDSAQKIKP